MAFLYLRNFVEFNGRSPKPESRKNKQINITKTVKFLWPFTQNNNFKAKTKRTTQNTFIDENE